MNKSTVSYIRLKFFNSDKQNDHIFYKIDFLEIDLNNKIL